MGELPSQGEHLPSDAESVPSSEELDTTLAELRRIAQLVGADAAVSVDWGTPGGGSYFDREGNSITLDPTLLLEENGQAIARFVAGHEGSHRAITRFLKESLAGAMSVTEAEKYQAEIGFYFIHNCLEDPRVNDFLCEKFPGFEQTVKEVYSGQVTSDAEKILSTPQVNEIISRLGYIPSFAYFGSEIIKYWYTGEYSDGLPASVQRALNYTQRSAQEFYSSENMPARGSAEAEVLAKSRITWEIFINRIWPFVKQLVDEDMLDEKLKQHLMDELKKAIKKAAESGQQGEGSPEGQLDEQTLGELAEKYGLDNAEKEELREALEKAMQKQKKFQDQQRERRRKGEIGSDELRETLKKSEGAIVDMKELSAGLKQKLKEAFDGEEPAIQQELEAQARRKLEDAEGVLNEQIEAKLGERPESHEERRRREAIEEAKRQEEEERQRQEEEERRKIEQALQEKASQRTEWEKAMSEYGRLINDLYQILEEYFRPRTRPGYTSGHDSGSRINMPAAMQSEVRPRTDIWERRTNPEKFDYTFTLLLDLSGSMDGGEKRENLFIATVILTEVLDDLGIPCQVVGYSSNGTYRYKGFDDSVLDNHTLRDPISGVKTDGGGTTPTLAATEQVIRELFEDRRNVIFVITDGEANENPRSVKLLSDQFEGRDNSGQFGEGHNMIVGIGIGDDINEAMLQAAYNRYIHCHKPGELAQALSELLERTITGSDA